MKDLLYRALMLGRNKKTAREEYLVATGEKQPASFDVSEKEILLEDVLKDRAVTIHIEVKTPGYMEIQVSSGDEAIQLENRLISTDEAAEEIIEFTFTVKADKIHNGKNFAEVTFRTNAQEISVPITIDNRVKLRISGENPKKIYGDITKGYLEFRMGRCSLSRWKKEVFERLGAINGNTPGDLFLMLYKAHVSIIARKKEGVEALLEYVSEELKLRDDISPELSAYHLYIESLYVMDDRRTDEALQTVRELYEANPSWPLLWMLFYMDEGFEDREKKFSEIKRLFEDGRCTSPIMYFEAYECIRKDPELIKSAKGFDLQVLNFAAGWKILDTASAIKLAQLIYEEEGETEPGLALDILKGAYEEHAVGSINNAIVCLLIKTGDREPKNHRYFERAVFDFLGLPGLYEYYVFTMDRSNTAVIPERVLQYFSKDATPLKDMRAYFYVNVIKNRYENHFYKTAYEACKNAIIAFAYNEALMGNNDEFLSVIYGEALQNAKDSTDIRQAIFKALPIRRIVCQSSIAERVMVFHRELNSYQEVTLEEGAGGIKTAYVRIYSEDAVILFKDGTDNIYKNVSYELREFESSKALPAYCIKDIPVNSLMLTGGYLSLTKEKKSPAQILDFLLENIEKNIFSKEYEKELISELISFYRSGDMSDEVYGKLTEFLKFDIGAMTRAAIIEFMIEKKHYDEAYKEIEEKGFEAVDSRILALLAHVLAQLESENSRVICGMCEKCVKDGIDDPELLRYLCRYFEGGQETLLLIYKKSAAYNIDSLRVAERIIENIMDAENEAEPELTGGIFGRCYKESRDRELVKDFLEFAACRYIYGKKDTDRTYFECIGKDLLSGREFSDRTKAAYVLYMEDKRQADPKLVKLAANVLEELVYRGIMLEEFKKYKDRMNLPKILLNSHIVSALRDNNEEVPVIKCSISSPEGETKYEKKMNEIFEGCFAEYFTVVYGDRLTYSLKEGQLVTVDFTDMGISKDSSRFSAVYEISRLKVGGLEEPLKEKLMDYYIKDRLIEKLF